MYEIWQNGKAVRYQEATEKYRLFQQKKDRINQMDSILTVSDSSRLRLTRFVKIGQEKPSYYAKARRILRR
jgi:hypothetical protein